MKALLSSSSDNLAHRLSRWLRIAGGLSCASGPKGLGRPSIRAGHGGPDTSSLCSPCGEF